MVNAMENRVVRGEEERDKDKREAGILIARVGRGVQHIMGGKSRQRVERMNEMRLERR